MTPRRPPQSQLAAAGASTVDAMPKRPTPAQPTLDQPAVELPELLTTAEVAAALRISQYVVREYVRTGVLPGYRVGRELRIARGDVARHLSTLRVAVR